MTDTPNTKATLYKKIAAVTAAVSRIPKNGHNKFFNYDYATESDITDSLRELLNTIGLAFLPPSVISWERDETIDNPKLGPRTRVQVQFGLGCTDTGETFTSMLWGEGQDSADKAFYKAYTGAVKYFLMKTFLIATGDDPEQDERQPAQQQRERPTTYAAQTNGERQAPADDAPLCPIHNKPMRAGKNNSWYCATKTEAGEWCKAKPTQTKRTIPDDWANEYDQMEAGN